MHYCDVILVNWRDHVTTSVHDARTQNQSLAHSFGGERISAPAGPAAIITMERRDLATATLSAATVKKMSLFNYMKPPYSYNIKT